MDLQTLVLVGGIFVLFTGTFVQGKQSKASLVDLLSINRQRRFDPLHDECGASPDERISCGRRADAIGKWECKSRGCCWDDTDRVERGTIRCFLAARMLTEECDVHYKDKDDCGYYGISEGECLARDCCWRPSDRVNDPPCFKKIPGNHVDIRLINYGTESRKEGRVEVFYENIWGTVCDDGFGKEEADVICRQQGYASGVPRIEAYYGEGSGTIWLDEMYCQGDETSFGRCDHAPWGQHDCSHYEDAGVTCYEAGEEPEPTPTPYYPDYSGDYYYSDEDDYWEEVEYMSRLKPKPGKKKGGKKGN